MKKTVSWSTQTLKETTKREACNTEQQNCEAPASTLTKSKSACAPTTVQVNSRIQQMIAMQKAQNANMRQLISTGHGGMSSASPSGLRELVRSPRKDKVEAPAKISVNRESSTQSPGMTHGIVFGTSKVEQLHPPAPTMPVAKNPPPQSHGIQFQKSNASPLSSLHQSPPLPPIIFGVPQQPQQSPFALTHPHLYPQMPNGGVHREVNDSPVSYNSVHDQDSTTFEIQERKLKQQQKMRASQQQPQSWNHKVMGYQTVQHESDVLPSFPMLNADNPESNLAVPSLSERQPLKQLEYKPGGEMHLYGTQEGGDGATSSVINHTHHQFHYGPNEPGHGSAYHNQAYEEEFDNAPGGDLPFDPEHLQRRIHRRRRGMLMNILCYPFQHLYSEQLSRSFCFGAIDGMLTGAGILSACVGLGLVSPYKFTHPYTLMPIALTLSATISEGICMAIGHVWSTSLVATTSYEDRRNEMVNFNINRSDVKARMVDTLLSHGMLKIDAMSLADTLEGYPDMFVNTLLGGGLWQEGGDEEAAVGYGGLGAPKLNPPLNPNQHQIDKTRENPLELRYESYSEFSQFHGDPDLKAVSEAVSESRLESLSMMLSFSCFSVIPSIVYVFFPSALNLFMNDADPYFVGHFAGPASFVISAVVMFFLGSWKSHFYSSSWLAFGLKNVGVLLVCIATAYSLGHFCGGVINRRA